MSIQRTVNDFVSRSRDLCHRLRSEGESLSDVDLVTLREQLYILDTEICDLQHLKEFRSDRANYVFPGRRSHAVRQLNRKAVG